MRYLIFILILASGVFIFKQAETQKFPQIKREKPTKKAERQKFPEIKAETLTEKEVVIPEITKGKHALIILAFKQESEDQVNSWADPFFKEFGDKEQITFYEVPMIPGNLEWMSGGIKSLMKSGISEHKHENVATFYGQRSKYFEHFDIENSKLAYTFLLNESGEIIWRDRGSASKKSYDELSSFVKKKTGIKQ